MGAGGREVNFPGFGNGNKFIAPGSSKSRGGG